MLNRTLVLLFVLFANSSSAADDQASEYLKRADSIRNPGQQYEMTVQIKTPDSESKLKVYLYGTDKTLIVTQSPANDIGRNMLMLDRDFYAYIPTLKRSVRLSLAQKLSGQIANGDIARTRWYGDYRIVSSEIKGKEIELLLEGNKPNLTYQKIRLRLESGSAKPVRADYLNLNGTKVIKTAIFEKYKVMAGSERPALIRIKDPSGKSSTMTFLSMTVSKFSENFFTEKNMESLR